MKHECHSSSSLGVQAPAACFRCSCQTLMLRGGHDAYAQCLQLLLAASSPSTTWPEPGGFDHLTFKMLCCSHVLSVSGPWCALRRLDWA